MSRRAGRWSRGVASGAFLAVLVVAGACTLAMDLDVLNNRACEIGQKECNGRCVPVSGPEDECGLTCKIGEKECDGRCVPEDEAEDVCGPKCEAGEVECNGHCVREDDPANECGPECGSEEKVCKGVCVPVSDPATGCGAASCEPCDIAHGTAACIDGACGVDECDADYFDCNDDPDDGCEVDLSSDRDHCGVCDSPCPAGWTCVGGQCDDSSEEFWDDLNYDSPDDPDLIQNGWNVRRKPGGPGVSGATWEPYILEFKGEQGNEANRLIVVASNTEGSPGSLTNHGELATAEQKFLHGTYAARIYFVEKPWTGPDTDKAGLSFFTFSRGAAPDDPEHGYGGMNAFYFPRGGMGYPARTMRLTTRDASDPSAAASDTEVMAMGFHTIVITADSATREVAYSIDGQHVGTHRDSAELSVYPKTAMGIGFSAWFLDGEIDTSTTEHRSYYLEVDWVFYAKDKVLSRADVERKVLEFREQKIVFKDTVP